MASSRQAEGAGVPAVERTARLPVRGVLVDPPLVDRGLFDHHIWSAPAEIPAQHEDRVGQHRRITRLAQLVLDKGELVGRVTGERQRVQPTDVVVEHDAQLAVFLVDALEVSTSLGHQELGCGDQCPGLVLAAHHEGSAFGSSRRLAERCKADAVAPALLAQVNGSGFSAEVTHGDTPSACRGTLSAPRVNMDSKAFFIIA